MVNAMTRLVEQLRAELEITRQQLKDERAYAEDEFKHHRELVRNVHRQWQDDVAKQSKAIDDAHADGVRAGRGETAVIEPLDRHHKWAFQAGVTEGRRQLINQAQNVAPFVAQILGAEWGQDAPPDNVVPIRPKGDA